MFGVLIFPRTAIREIEERWCHSLYSLGRCYSLCTRSFLCTDIAQLHAHMFDIRIRCAIDSINNDITILKIKLKECEYEQPLFILHKLIGTYNHHCLVRVKNHIQFLEISL